MIDDSQRKAAKVFGITYLLTFVIVTVAFFRFYAPLMGHTSTETARNVFANEHAFRLYLAADLIYGIGLVVLLVALYIILSPVSRGLALFAASTRMVYAFLWFVTMVLLFNASRMGTADYQGMLESNRLQSLAGLQLASSFDAYYIGLTFYGLGSIFFSFLWLKSRYIPRAIAVLGILSSAFEGFCAFAYLIFPSFGKIVSVDWYELPIALFEVATCIWLLVKGLKHPDMASIAKTSR